MTKAWRDVVQRELKRIWQFKAYLFMLTVLPLFSMLLFIAIFSKGMPSDHPLYRFPLFQKKGMGAHDCPVLDKWWDDSFSFPWWCGVDDPEGTNEKIDLMCERLRAAVLELRG